MKVCWLFLSSFKSSRSCIRRGFQIKLVVLKAPSVGDKSQYVQRAQKSVCKWSILSFCFCLKKGDATGITNLEALINLHAHHLKAYNEDWLGELTSYLGRSNLFKSRTTYSLLPHRHLVGKPRKRRQKTLWGCGRNV